jgi:hypothetical protein
LCFGRIAGDQGFHRWLFAVMVAACLQENAMRLPTPFDFLPAAVEASAIALESQMVIGLRLAGLAGLWPMGQAEADRMVAEKLKAGFDSVEAVLRSGLAGGTLPEMALAAMQPVRQETRSNAQRLQRAVIEG